jgi:hypothetical protein
VGGAIFLLPLRRHCLFMTNFTFLFKHKNGIPRATEASSTKYLSEQKNIQNKR